MKLSVILVLTVSDQTDWSCQVPFGSRRNQDAKDVHNPSQAVVILSTVER